MCGSPAVLCEPAGFAVRVFADHRLSVPPRLQELYDMYVRELDERTLDRAVALDRMSNRHPVKVGLDTTAMDLSVLSSATLSWSF